MRSCRSIVQGSEDSRGATLLNKIADDLVVEVFDLRPLNPLTYVFLLLGLEGQLDENLLQLFIDVVDAELLKRVFLELRFSVASRSRLKVSPRRSQIQRYPVEHLVMDLGLRVGLTYQNSNQLACCPTRFH